MKYFSRLKSPLLKNSLIYIISDGISKSLSFLTLPIVSIYLIPAQLGIASNFDVLQSIIMLIAGQTIVNAIPYFYYERTHREVSILVSNLILIVITISILFSCVIILSTGIIAEYLHIGLCLQLLTIVSVITQLVSSIDLCLFRLEDRPVSFMIFQLVKTTIYLSLLLFLVAYKEMGAIGKIYTSVISSGIVCLFHIIMLLKRKYITLRFCKDEIILLLKFGIPLLPHALSFWIRGGMDKILLTAYCGLSFNGLYSMGLSIGSVYTIFRQAFDLAYTPYITKRISQIGENNISENKRIVKQVYQIALLFIVLSIITIGVSWVIIEYVLSANYQGSFFFIPGIIISATIYSLYSLFIQFSYIKKKTKGIGIITFSGSCIQCALSFFLIRQLGPSGLNFSLIFGAFLIMVGIWWYSNKVYPLPWFSFFK